MNMDEHRGTARPLLREQEVVGSNPLCLHDGGLLDMQALCKNLAVKKPTATNFIELLAAVHLIHKLPPLGYGKEVLRGRHKVYLADAAISPSVLSKGRALLEDAALLGRAELKSANRKNHKSPFNNGNL